MDYQRRRQTHTSKSAASVLCGLTGNGSVAEVVAEQAPSNFRCGDRFGMSTMEQRELLSKNCFSQARCGSSRVGFATHTRHATPAQMVGVWLATAAARLDPVRCDQAEG
jgi:hypothetical protein